MAAETLRCCALIISAAILAIATTAQWEWGADLWAVSAEIQQRLQDALPQAEGFFQVLATCSLIVTVLPQCVLFYFSSPHLGTQVAVLSALASAGTALLKLLYRDPRPYWSFPQVEGMMCLSDWGTPSGHALYSSAVWGSVAVLCWRSKRRVCSVVVLLWLLLVGVDRLYVGAHFISQVILGWAWGALLVCMFAYGLYDRKYFSQRALGVWLCVSVACVCAAFYCNQLEYAWDDVWTNRIAESCDGTFNPDNVQGSCLVESSHFAFIPGLLVGYFLTQDGSVYPNIETATRRAKCTLTMAAAGLTTVEISATQWLKHFWPGTCGLVLALAVSGATGYAFSAVIPKYAPKTPLFVKT